MGSTETIATFKDLEDLKTSANHTIICTMLQEQKISLEVINQKDEKKRNLLFYAIELEDDSMIQAIMNYENIEHINEAGATSLMYAIKKNISLDTFKYMVQRTNTEILNAHTEIKDAQGNTINSYTALILATKKRDVEKIKCLLDANADINCVDFENRTALYHAFGAALDSNDITIVNLLLAKNPEYNEGVFEYVMEMRQIQIGDRDVRIGQTNSFSNLAGFSDINNPQNAAVDKGNINKEFFRKRDEIIDRVSIQMFDWAIRSKNEELIKKIITNRDSEGGFLPKNYLRPMEQLIEKVIETLNIAELDQELDRLLEKGEDINEPVYYGPTRGRVTLLQQVIEKAKNITKAKNLEQEKAILEFIRKIVKSGAKVADVRPYWGETWNELRYVLQNFNTPELFEILSKANDFDVNHKFTNNQTGEQKSLLHYALANTTTGGPQMVKALVEKGLTIDQFDENGNNILQQIIMKEQWNSTNSIINLLFLARQPVIDINHQNKQGQTFLMLLLQHTKCSSLADERYYAREAKDFLEQMKKLVKIDIEIKDYEGRKALNYLSEHSVDNKELQPLKDTVTGLGARSSQLLNDPLDELTAKTISSSQSETVGENDSIKSKTQSIIKENDLEGNANRDEELKHVTSGNHSNESQLQEEPKKQNTAISAKTYVKIAGAITMGIAAFASLASVAAYKFSPKIKDMLVSIVGARFMKYVIPAALGVFAATTLGCVGFSLSTRKDFIDLEAQKSAGEKVKIPVYTRNG